MEADDHQDDEIKESMSDVEDDKDGSKVSSKAVCRVGEEGGVGGG